MHYDVSKIAVIFVFIQHFKDILYRFVSRCYRLNVKNIEFSFFFIFYAIYMIYIYLFIYFKIILKSRRITESIALFRLILK